MLKSTIVTINININVENTSQINGTEIVQLYSSDLYASVTPDIKRLRDFSRVILNAGIKETVSFNLPVSELAFVNSDNEFVVEPGKFKLQINNLSKEITIE